MSKRQNQRAPDDDTRTRFLTVNDVKSGDVLRLTGFTRELAGRFGEQIVAEVVLERTNTRYDWAFKKGGDVHRKLFHALGSDPQKWRGAVTVKIGRRGSMEWIDYAEADSDNAPFEVPGERVGE